GSPSPPPETRSGMMRQEAQIPSDPKETARWLKEREDHVDGKVMAGYLKRGISDSTDPPLLEQTGKPEDASAQRERRWIRFHRHHVLPMNPAPKLPNEDPPPAA